MSDDEHAWHACTVPAMRLTDFRFEWPCPVCGQVWIWRRPPRPAAQWVRRDSED